MYDKLTPTARIAAYLFVPLALVLLLPLVLVFVIGYYGFVLVQSVRSIIEVLLGRRAKHELTVQRPHFLDMPRESAAVPDAKGESHDRS